MAPVTRLAAASPIRDSMAAMTTVGLVLGAGGVVGGAYHAGALAALADATGWDPRSRRPGRRHLGRVRRTAASLRAGPVGRGPAGPGHRRPLSTTGPALVGTGPGPFAPRRARRGRRARRSARSLSLPAPGPVAAGSGAAPRPARPAGGWPWPAWCPAGRRRPPPIGERVRATAAGTLADRAHLDRRLPHPRRPAGRVRPRRRRGARPGHRGRGLVRGPGPVPPGARGVGRYLDGAVYSPTNADLVAGLAFDLVIVSSPMSADRRRASGDGRSLAGRTTVVVRPPARPRGGGDPWPGARRSLVLEPGPDRAGGHPRRPARRTSGPAGGRRRPRVGAGPPGPGPTCGPLVERLAPDA